MTSGEILNADRKRLQELRRLEEAIKKESGLPENLSLGWLSTQAGITVKFSKDGKIQGWFKDGSKIGDSVFFSCVGSIFSISF